MYSVQWCHPCIDMCTLEHISSSNQETMSSPLLKYYPCPHEIYVCGSSVSHVCSPVKLPVWKTIPPWDLVLSEVCALLVLSGLRRVPQYCYHKVWILWFRPNYVFSTTVLERTSSGTSPLPSNVISESPAASSTVTACSSVPAAMLFKHHAASSCVLTLSSFSSSTSRCIEPSTLTQLQQN